MNEPDDKTLMEQCTKGDRQAFESLLIRYEKPVYNAAYRMLHSRDDARDVTQTVFLKVYENLDSYDPKFRFFSWIYRIALNESVNLLKKTSRLDSLDTQSPDREPASQTQGPEQQAVSDEISAEVQTALQTIKSDYRSIIVLKHFLGCSYTEISEILEVPEKTVKSRLYTARQVLKDALDKNGKH
jgi:RNA polymerase sigma-70 factor (ECF subfamily)